MNPELDRIKQLAGLNEGAQFTGYYKDPKDPQGNRWTYPDTMDTKTPYRSNFAAREFLSRIGMDPDFEENPPIPLEDFIDATQKYMLNNVADKDSDQYDEVEMYHQEARRFMTQHKEITHVQFA